MKKFSSDKTLKIFKTKKNFKIAQWKKEEDEIFLEILSTKKRNKWKLLLNILTNKSYNECNARYRFLKNQYTKGRWTKQEDEKIISLVNCFGKNWKLISKVIKNRLNKQIRSRFTEHLDENLNKSNFSLQEDNKILELFSNFQNKFRGNIFKHYFINRTTKSLSNRLKFLLRNRIDISDKFQWNV